MDITECSYVLNSVSVVCLSKRALEDCVYSLYYYIKLFSLFSFVSQVIYATAAVLVWRIKILSIVRLVFIADSV